MARDRSHTSSDDRIWALTDRTRIAPNRVRAQAMRTAPTEAEKKLWWHLRHRLAVKGTHFRRQVRLGRYIVDFVCHQTKVIVEVDGGQHAERVKPDSERTRFLEAEGYRVLRFWNNDVLGNIDGVRHSHPHP